MNTENKLVELGNYFKNKVIEGNYQLKNVTEHIAEILIDEKYSFRLWNCSGVVNFRFYTSIKEDNILNDYLIFSEKEKKKAFDVLNPMVKILKETVIRKEKELLLNQLKKELCL